MFSFKTTVKSGLVALAILIAMLSIRIASANTDADWAIHHDVYQDTVNLINLDGYQIEYWAGECVLRLDSSFTRTIDYSELRIDPISRKHDRRLLSNDPRRGCTGDYQKKRYPRLM